MTNATKIELIFSGLQNDDADTLRKVKSVFIADLGLSVDNILQILEAPPSKIIQSESETEIFTAQALLNAAGAITDLRYFEQNEEIDSLQEDLKEDLLTEEMEEISFEFEEEKDEPLTPTTPNTEVESQAKTSCLSHWLEEEDLSKLLEEAIKNEPIEEDVISEKGLEPSSTEPDLMFEFLDAEQDIKEESDKISEDTVSETTSEKDLLDFKEREELGLVEEDRLSFEETEELGLVEDGHLDFKGKKNFEIEEERLDFEEKKDLEIESLRLQDEAPAKPSTEGVAKAPTLKNASSLQKGVQGKKLEAQVSETPLQVADDNSTTKKGKRRRKKQKNKIPWDIIIPAAIGVIALFIINLLFIR